MVMNYSEVESKVREATNDDTWGPHGNLMTEIAKYTFTYEHYPEVMSMVWRRMFESKKNWRRTYKVCARTVIGSDKNNFPLLFDVVYDSNCLSRFSSCS